MLNFNLICLHFAIEQCHLERLPLFLNLFNHPIFSDLLPKLLKSASNALENLIHLLFLRVALIQHTLHLLDSRIERLCPSDFFEHLQEALFSLSYNPFNLALLNNLKLRLSLERETTGLKDVEKLLLLNMYTIQVVGVAVSIHIVGFLNSNFSALESHSLVSVIQDDLN